MKTYLIITFTTLIIVLTVLILVSKTPSTKQTIPTIPSFVAPSAKPVFPQATTLPSIAPTISSPVASPSTQLILSREQLINLLPIQTKEFDIEYFSKFDSIIVTIKESPYAENKKKAESWFRGRGVIDFTGFNISWTSYRYVQ